MVKKKTPGEFIEEMEELVGDEYTVLQDYVKSSEKVLLRHNTCGNEWKTRPGTFLRGSRCPECAIKSRYVSQEEAERRVQSIEEGKYLLESEYTGKKGILNIRHKECGKTFEMTAGVAFKRLKCPWCRPDNPRMSTESYESKMREVVGDEYVLQCEIKTTKHKVDIMHEGCGQTHEYYPYNFLRKPSCPICHGGRGRTEKSFWFEVPDKTDGNYLYVSGYKNTQEKAKLIHLECGNIFEVVPNDFFKGTRCPKCYSSKGESKIEEVLEGMRVSYIREDAYEIKGRLLRFDFSLPELNAKIEYDGEHHFEEVELWGAEEGFKKVKERDALKNEFCEDRGVSLLRIPYWEINNVETIVAEFVKELEQIEEIDTEVR